MKYYRVGAMVAAMLLTAGLMMSAVADDEQKKHAGVVVSIDAERNQLVMEHEGDQHSHDIGPAVKITLNGQRAVLRALRSGDKIVVTMDDDGEVVSIEATREEEA